MAQTQTDPKKCKNGNWRTRTPEALAAARETYPDARRATVSRPIKDKAADIVGQTIKDRGEPTKILRCEVEDINGQWGEAHDAGYGYRLHLIVSALALTEAVR